MKIQHILIIVLGYLFFKKKKPNTNNQPIVNHPIENDYKSDVKNEVPEKSEKTEIFIKPHKDFVNQGIKPIKQNINEPYLSPDIMPVKPIKYKNFGIISDEDVILFANRNS